VYECCLKNTQQNKWATMTSGRPAKLVCRKTGVLDKWCTGKTVRRKNSLRIKGTGFSRAESKNKNQALAADIVFTAPDNPCTRAHRRHKTKLAAVYSTASRRA
jgi:hypothetical protein